MFRHCAGICRKGPTENALWLNIETSAIGLCVCRNCPLVVRIGMKT